MGLLENTLDRLEEEFWDIFDGSQDIGSIVFELANGFEHENALDLFLAIAQYNYLVLCEEHKPIPAKELIKNVVYSFFFDELCRKLQSPENALRIDQLYEAKEKEEDG